MRIINTILKISGILLLLSLMVGCKADELPCKSSVQVEYELVK
jgi:hypothetical protein